MNGLGWKRSSEGKLRTNGNFSKAGLLIRDWYEVRITDPVGWKSEKEAQVLALQQKVLEVWEAPEGIAKHLLEKTKDAATDHTVSFLDASQFEQMETLGELAGDIAPFFIGVGEAKQGFNASQIWRRKDWVKKTSSSYETIDGTRIETRWYQNSETGQRVEHKTNFIKKGKTR